MLVDIDESSLTIVNEQGIRRLLHQRSKPTLAFSKCALGPNALGYIP